MLNQSFRDYGFAKPVGSTGTSCEEELKTLQKIYVNLRPKQLAELYYRHSLKEDESEIRKILASVPRKVYSCLDMEFAYARDTYFDIALAWGMDFWRTRCLLFEALRYFASSLDKESLEDADFFIETAKRQEARLLAADQALDSICAELGIDPAMMRAFSEAEPHESILQVSPDKEAYAEMESALRNLALRFLSGS